MVGSSYTKNYTGSVGFVLVGHFVFAHERMRQAAGFFRRAAWYQKSHPTFSDALALVRRELWAQESFCGLPAHTETVKVPKAYMERLTDALCYAV